MQTSDLIRDLFKSFHDNNIVYCHWKSNEHLDASFKGDTDFDVLFNRNQKAEVKELFCQNGFILFNPPFNRRYHEIEDFIAIDYKQKKIIHFHTHYALEIGTSGLKEYRFNIEEEVLDTRVFSKIYDCYLINPRYELLLLILRLSLKVKSSWKSKFKTNREVIHANIEFDWLKKRVSFEQFMSLIGELEIPYKKEDISNIYTNGFDFETFYSISLQKNKIKNLEKDKFFNRLFKKWTKWVYFQYGRVMRKTGLSYVVKRRVNPEGGFSIAVLGSDGSGKSTQMKELKKIFSTKIDVESFYLGSNKGSRSGFRKLLDFIEDKNLYFNIRALERILNLLFALTIGFEKKVRLKKALKLKKKGVLVLFDRFPQTDNYTFNDGPLLKKAINSKNIIYKSIGRYEKKLYSPSLDKYPDIIIKLIADPNVLAKRRDMSLEQINTKQNSIIELTFENKVPIVKIDANMSIEEVTSEILWIIQDCWLNKVN